MITRVIKKYRMAQKTYCFFSSHYLPYLGGVERYTYNLTNELIKKGNKVIIVTSQMKGEPDYKESKDLTLIRLESYPVLNDRFPILRHTRRNNELIHILLDKSIDYIIVNTRFYLLSFFATQLAKKNNIPAIVIEHGTGHFTVSNKLLDKCGHVYEHLITNMVKSQCDNFYGVSKACNIWLKHFNIVAKGVIYNSIDLSHIDYLYENVTDTILGKFDYKPTDFIITYTGRLLKEKGLIKLIDAFSRLRLKYENVKLCVAGDGDLYATLSQTSSEGVYLLGRLSFTDVVNLLKYTDIYCLPTDYPEGLPTSVLEAIACKAYVVTTQAGGSKEVITSPEYGTILKENTETTLYNAIEHIMNDNPARLQAVEKAYDRVKSLFTWEATATTIINIFERKE